MIVVSRQFSYFSAISCREQVNFEWDDDVRFVLDQHAELDLYSASSLKQQSAGRLVAPLWHIILIPSTRGYHVNHYATEAVHIQKVYPLLTYSVFKIKQHTLRLILYYSILSDITHGMSIWKPDYIIKNRLL